jgi:hypothetical protein
VNDARDRIRGVRIVTAPRAWRRFNAEFAPIGGAVLAG